MLSRSDICALLRLPFLLLLLTLGLMPLSASATSFTPGYVEISYSAHVGVTPGSGDPDCLDIIFPGAAPPGLTAYVVGCNLYLSGTPTTAGTFSVDATYQNATTSYSVSILPSATALSVSSSAASAALGSSVTFTATLTRGNGATGTVSFLDNGTLIGTAAPSGGVATLATSSLNAGSHAITAAYSGDANYSAANSSGSASVTISKASPSLSLSASTATASVGDTVVLTASLSNASSPTGTITFRDGATTLGTASISSNTATYSASFSTAGLHNITAEYAGDTNNNGASSNTATLTTSMQNSALQLSVSSTSASAGTTLTFTATVQQNFNATGTVTFMDGATTLGSASVSGTSLGGNTAIFTTTALAPGIHAISAVYSGDYRYTGSSSSGVVVSITMGTPTITLAATPASVNVGGNVTLTATLAGGSAPGGTVTFKDGSTTLGTGTISGSTATYVTSSLGVGSHALTAVYGGDTSNYSATSSAVSVTVAAAAPTVTLTSSATSISAGGSVTLTATLAGGSAPGGTVTFKDGSTTLGTGTISGTSATYIASALGVGNHALTAIYGGDANNSSATSSAVSVAVASATPTVALTASATSVSIGGSVTLTATLTGGSTPGGTVTFKDGSTTLGTGTISGSSATYIASALAIGSHALTAIYGGDSNNASAASSAVNVSVATATPTIALAASSTSIAAGGSVTLTATVSGGNAPAGTVTFQEGSTTLGTGTISGGKASFTTGALQAGSHSITAVYGGDASNGSATSSSVSITVASSTPTLSLATSASTVSAGGSVTLTATVSGGSNPGGNIIFVDGSTTLGAAAISGGRASFTTAALASGSHAFSAVYAGDGNNRSASSSSVHVTVSAAKPTLSLSTSASAPPLGTAVTLSATLAGGNAATGTITFKDGATTLGSASLGGNSASFSTGALSVGSHSITATYSGDAGNSATTSAAVSITVAAATPAITLSASATSINAGASVTLNATLSGGSAPGGTVSFQDGGTTLGSSAISGASASFSTAALAAGSHSLTAVYGGDASNRAVTSAVLTVTVNAIAPTIGALSPATGPTTGGTSVTISGSNLANATAVTFGGTSAAKGANSATSLTVTAPAHAAGAVAVVVTTANGSVSAANAYTYEAKADPTKDATVVGALSAQVQATRLFASTQVNNFAQRLSSLHSDAWSNNSGFGLTFNNRNANPEQTNRWAYLGDIVNPDKSLESLRRHLRKTASNAAAQPAERNGDSNADRAGYSNLPELADNAALRQPLSLWVSGSVDLGDARDGSAHVQTNGISAGGDYRFNRQWTLGLGAGYSSSNATLGNDGSNSSGDAVNVVAYGTYRPAKAWYVDGMLGYGVLNFSTNRYLDATGEFANGKRDGHQLFASLAAGYEFSDDTWLLAPYARLDLTRPTLDQYSEQTTAASRAEALTYFRQTLKSTAASLGLRGEWRYVSPLGVLQPQLALAYQHSLQSGGTAGIAYADLAAAGPAYYITDRSVDNSQWLSTVGSRLLLKNDVTLQLLYMRNLANSAVLTRSVVFKVEGRF